jgi:YHS domain-containing protein
MGESSFNLALLPFARSHLRSPAERAVWSVVAGSADWWWSVKAVARSARVSDHAAGRCLHRFAAAGIVDERHTPGTPREFRWASEMHYLVDDRSEDGLELGRRDPVCGMPVRSSSSYRAEVDGDEAWFCSLPCLVRWRRDNPHDQGPPRVHR